MPRGVLFGIWTKDFGGPFQQVASGLRVGVTGAMETIDGAGQPRPLDEIVFDPGGCEVAVDYTWGEPALVSSSVR